MVMMHSARHLEMVRALGEHRHFGRAAETLGISQPALSKGLNHIEETIGVRLFDRNGAVTPTEFGEIVLAHSGAILNGFSELQHEIEMAKGLGKGNLLISAGIFAADSSAQQAVGALSLLHPNLRCSLFVKDWVGVNEDVLNRSSHLGFADITDARKHPDLETELVCEEQLVVFARGEHPLAQRNQITFADMLQYPWVGTSLPSSWRENLPQEASYGMIDERSDRAVTRIVVENFTSMLRVVKSGNAICAAPRRLVEAELKTGAIAQLQVDLPWMKANFGFIWRRGRSLPPSALAFMEIVRTIEAASRAASAA
jgi:DNA-binding transcriptional LysR family regulator